MYKIFINEKPFIISQVDATENLFSKCKRVDYNPSKMIEYIKDTEGMRSNGFVMICDDVEMAFKDFFTHFVCIEAAGGAVFNHEGKILLIKRLGKWDLPKGKIDGGELREEAAMREVTEECGIDKLIIEKKLENSYHTYRMHNHRFLKITNWYLMKTPENKKPTPQLEENITEADWFDWKKLDVENLDTYSSIKDILLTLKKSL
ncbi:MAG: NUDIX domain-containing protein [Bacteroidota bacterium]